MEMGEKKFESIHAGHRRRLLETYLRTGLEGFSDVEALELLLGYAISRRDVNPIAHALLNEFGDLHRVLDAPVAQLIRVPGVGERTAVLIHMIAELWSKSESSRFGKAVFLHSAKEIGDYLAHKSVGLREERAWLLSLDAKCKLIECRELCRGAVNAVNLPFRKLVEAALLVNASSVVLAHNHTTGTMIPSLEDVEYTRKARRALEMVDVILNDHLVLCDGSYLSMRASHMMDF
ncbi:MAG: DNA repair protein RadC [Oscillospiraceae bacterium]|nr:DNA repair protein RadC [Oscillospiraceae bacterium]